MKKTLLLLVIYLAFISLGLPDSMLGAGWPSMFETLNTPIHYAGIIYMIIAGCTVIASLLSARLIKKFDIPTVTAFSVLLTAVALLGFSYSNSFVFLCLLAIPLGLGGGCVDAVLNNYVALNYEARHMNWLHCFWGVGASLGPIIMAKSLATGQLWSSGYNTIGWIQICLVIILFLSVPLWIKSKDNDTTQNVREESSSIQTILKIPRLKKTLIIFFCYCTIETTFGLWGASYLVLVRDLEPDAGARLVAVFYIGITVGRFLSGVLTAKFSNKQLIYIGQGLIIIGVLTLFLPYEISVFPGFLLIGFGCAPIFPSLLHETPRNFGEKQSQSIMGMQMASAYIGATIMPLVFGLLAAHFSFSFLLVFICIVTLIMLYFTIDLNRRTIRQS